MLTNSYFWLFAALFDLHLHLIINVLSRAIPRERLQEEMIEGAHYLKFVM
jgi:hypothetical protein